MAFQIPSPGLLEPVVQDRFDIDHDASEPAHPAPALPPIAEGLWRTIFTGRVTPAQANAIYEYIGDQDAAIIGPGTAMAFAREGMQPRQLRVSQPEIAQQKGLLGRPESLNKTTINEAGVYGAGTVERTQGTATYGLRIMVAAPIASGMRV